MPEWHIPMFVVTDMAFVYIVIVIHQEALTVLLHEIRVVYRSTVLHGNLVSFFVIMGDLQADILKNIPGISILTIIVIV